MADDRASKAIAQALVEDIRRRLLADDPTVPGLLRAMPASTPAHASLWDEIVHEALLADLPPAAADPVVGEA